jgi:GNAT superfamily N-acetyltransferase
VTEVELSDGSRVEIRQLGPDDRAGLAAGFERLSELSRYRRFLSPTSHLTPQQLAYLTEVDHHDHEALVAVEPSGRQGLAIARYVRSGENPREAEAAVAVADDWQRRGLGIVLLRQLAVRARDEGIVCFRGLVLKENEAVRHLLETLGEIQEREADEDTIEVALRIPDRSPGREHDRTLAGWVRAAATGELRSRLKGRAREEAAE